MWECSKCDARVDPPFDVCWRCGTDDRGVENPEFVTADEASPIVDPNDFLKLDVGKIPVDELPDPPLELVPCFEAGSLLEANLVIDELAAEGVRATSWGIPRAGGMPATSSMVRLCSVVVRVEDLTLARKIVDAFVARARSRSADGG